MTVKPLKRILKFLQNIFYYFTLIPLIRFRNKIIRDENQKKLLFHRNTFKMFKIN